MRHPMEERKMRNEIKETMAAAMTKVFGEIAGVYTHGGVFHADDVFSVALIQLGFQGIKVERGFNPESQDGVLVIDIGGGEFDHHQEAMSIRENGIERASLGKLWEALRPELPQVVFNRLDEALVQEIDSHDCTGAPSALCSAISAMNLNWDEESNPSTQMEAFCKAVEVASTVLISMLEGIFSKLQAKTEAEAAYASSSDKRIVQLERFVPIGDTTMPEGKFIVFPSLRGGFNAQAIRGTGAAFPQSWGGQSPEFFEELGVTGVTFCHKGCFILAAKTREEATKAVVAALL